MFLYVLLEDIKNDLKLFNNAHIFEPKFILKDTSNGEFWKWISQSHFSFHQLRTEKGFSETFGSKKWVLLKSFKSFLMKTLTSSPNSPKGSHP